MAKKRTTRSRVKKSQPPRSLGQAMQNRLLPDPESFDREDLPEYLFQQMKMNSLSEPDGPIVNVPQNVRMVGVISPPPGMRTTSVPRDLRQHELLGNNCFYTLPLELLKAVEIEIKSLVKSNDLWAMEKGLAEICGDHSQQVGFARGQPLQFGMLRMSKPMVVTEKDVKALGWTVSDVAEVSLAAKTYEKRSKWFNTIARGFAGWLNCNPEFRRERDAVLAAGTCVVSITPEVFADASGVNLPPSIRDFLVRWRLTGMAGQRLPVPMRPMLAGQFPLTVLPQLMAAGGLFNLPDTYPIPSRDELRTMLEEAIRSEKPSHLQDWTSITSQSNAAKNQIERYSRLFELQHFWELLNGRHGDRLQRHKTKLQFVFASYLSTSEKSIEGDLGFLRSRLGRDWPSRTT